MIVALVPVRLIPPAGDTIVVAGAVLSMRTATLGPAASTLPAWSMARVRSEYVPSAGSVQVWLQRAVPDVTGA